MCLKKSDFGIFTDPADLPLKNKWYNLQKIKEHELSLPSRSSNSKNAKWVRVKLSKKFIQLSCIIDTKMA